MAWFKVDDGLHASRKFQSIPKRARFAAVGAWTIAGSWCADQLTDGFVPDYMLELWGVPPSAPSALVEAGLWGRESGGYLFCNWLEYQPRKADVDAEREASRERMRDLRAKRKQKKPQDDAEGGEVFGRTDSNGSENVRNPDPTRPDPVPKEVPKGTSTRKARGSRITDQWMPDQTLIQQMQAECPGVDLEAEHRIFIDYWIAQPGQKGVKTDWAATWRNWMRRKHADLMKRPPQQRATSKADNAWDFVNSLEEPDGTQRGGNGAGTHLELRQ